MKIIKELCVKELREKIPQLTKKEAALYFNCSEPTIKKYARKLSLEFKKGQRGRRAIELV